MGRTLGSALARGSMVTSGERPNGIGVKLAWRLRASAGGSLLGLHDRVAYTYYALVVLPLSELAIGNQS